MTGAPTLVAARTALPPEGAVACDPAKPASRLENVAPTLVAARTALPPEGAVACDPAKPASRLENVAPTLVAARTALPPEGAVACDPAKPASRLEMPGALSAAQLPWELFICKACGLIYDEEKGDADSGLAAGTRFADIPDDWACPLCGVTKSDFEPYVMEAAPREARRSSSARAGSSRRHAGTVIVGAGRAGWQMAQSLRARDAAMPITIVTSCSGDVYDKPLLSVALARGIPMESMARESGEAAARRLGVRLLANTQAVRVLPRQRQLRTSRGALPYRHLVLAHGAQARSLPRFPSALCWRINHLQAYAAFRSALGDAPRRVAIAGAGLIGCELANDLALAGHQVTLIDIADRPLASCLSEAQSAQLLQAWATLPLNFVGGCDVEKVEAIAAGGKRIHCQSGRMFVVDQVVVAAGLQTPGRLASSAGLAFDNGIAVTADTLATSVAGIHALGDCISINGQVSRYIEPIARQALTLSAMIAGDAALPYQHTRVPLRVKTTSQPFTL